MRLMAIRVIILAYKYQLSKGSKVFFHPSPEFGVFKLTIFYAFISTEIALINDHADDVCPDNADGRE